MKHPIETTIDAAIEAGEDPYLRLVANDTDLPYEEARSRYKAGDQDIVRDRAAYKAFCFTAFGWCGEWGVRQ